MDASQVFDGSPRQLFGIISLDDRHLGQSWINRHRVTAFQIDCQLWFGALAVLAQPESEACHSGSDSSQASSLINLHGG